LHGGLQNPGLGGSSRLGIFNNAAYGSSRLDSVALGAGSDSLIRDAFAGNSQNISRMFDELTTQDDANDQGLKGEERVSPSVEKERDTLVTDEDMPSFFDGP